MAKEVVQRAVFVSERSGDIDPLPNDVIAQSCQPLIEAKRLVPPVPQCCGEVALESEPPILIG